MKKKHLPIFIFTFLMNMHLMGALTIPFFQDKLSFSYVQIFILQSVFAATVFLSEVPLGILSDTLSRKYTLQLAACFWFVGWLIYGTVYSFWALLAAEIILALGIACASGTDQALLYDLLLEDGDESRSRQYLARLQAFRSWGMMAGFILGPLSIRLPIWDYPKALSIPFYLTALTGLMAVGLAFFINDPSTRQPEMDPAQTPKKSSSWDLAKQSFVLLLSTPEFRGLVINTILISGLTFYIFWLYQPFALKTGYPIMLLGLLAAGFNGAGALLCNYVSWFEKRVPITRILFLTSVLPGILFIAMPFIRVWWIMVPVIVVIAALKLVRQPIMSDFINQRIESHQRATVLSSVSMLERLLMFGFNPIFGLLCDQSIHYAAWFSGTAILIIALVLPIRKRMLVF